jgi:CSLREA domain-containing protein
MPLCPVNDIAPEGVGGAGSRGHTRWDQGTSTPWDVRYHAPAAPVTAASEVHLHHLPHPIARSDLYRPQSQAGSLRAVPIPSQPRSLGRSRPRRIILVLGIFVAMVAAGVLPTLRADASDGPVLRLSAPVRVAEGEPIALDLTIANAPTLGAFEGTLSLDTDKAYLSGIDAQGSELAQLGRGVVALGPAGRTGSESFGFYLCRGVTCVTHARAKADRAAPRVVTAARLLVTPQVTGRLELIVTGRAFDRAGQRIALAGSMRRIVVQVGEGTRLHLAPRAGVLRPTRASIPGSRSLDLTRDGVTSNADAMEVAMAWQSARESGDACGRGVGDQNDTNGDGCIDIADVQLVASKYSPAPRSPRAALTTATWVVNSTSDSSDANAGNGTCATSFGSCTLRAAIQEADAHAGPDVIDFSIGGGGVRTIQLGSSLPSLTDETGPTTIDGYTQPGASVNTAAVAFNANILIEVRGNGERSFPGIAISSAGNTIRGISIYAMPVHIRLTGPGSHDNDIVGNLIGTNASASYVSPNRVERSGAVHLDTSANHNHIGLPTLADRNVVSGTSSEAIYLTGAKDDVFQNNIVGLSPDGSRRLLNRIHGIDLNFGSARNLVGGMGPLEHNVVGGNIHTGIEISHGTNTIDNQIIGNYVGTTLDGTRSPSYAGNDDWGIHVNDGPNGNLVAGNTVGSSRLGGIAVRGYLTTNNTVRDNRSGISVDGSAIPNQIAGIVTTYHAIRTTIGPGNIVANNPVGILIDAADSYGNIVTRNSIFGNVNLGIELAPAGPNPNDAGDTDVGPNTRLNFPVLALATPVQIRGTACAACTVEAFIAESRATDLGGGNYGQPRTFVGAATAGGDGWFTIVPPPGTVAAGQRITSTATDADGNTSESSLDLTATAAPPPGTYALDSFTRNMNDAWGYADAGGPWSLAGTPSDFDVNGSAGIVTLPAANASRAATLFAVSRRDVDLAIRLHTGASFANAHVYLVGRRSTAATISEYRARLRLATDGRVYLAATRVTGGTEALIGTETLVPGLTYAAGQDLGMRAQVAGEDPTRIRIRAWPSTQPEPADWNLTVSDGTATLQVPGAVGVRAYLGGGATSPVTLSFDDLAAVEAPLPADPPPVAQDAFARTVAGGWGTADAGGAYTVAGGPASDFSVDGSSGAVVVSAPGVSRSASLMSVSVRDVVGSVTVSADSTVVGAHLYQVLRRSVGPGGTTEYRARVRIATGGALYLQLTRVVNSTETALTAEVLVPGNQAAGQAVRILASVSGAAPTTIKARAWIAGTTEPATWQATTTDSTAALEAPGAVGVRAYLASNATNAPFTLRFDDLLVSPAAP